MLLIAGIIPSNDMPLIKGQIKKEQDFLLLDGYKFPCSQGTAAMISSALAVCETLDLQTPHVVLAGDTGLGKGSRAIYKYLIENLDNYSPRVLALHYWMPSLLLMKKLYQAVVNCQERPILIADAASMYAAKAAGLANEFDVFTPDVSELAFLADPDAIHPAYIKKHLFESDDNKIPEFIEKAYQLKGAAKILLVKGAVDYIAGEKGIVTRIQEPDIPELECIGGTGDTITGMVAALIYAGIDMENAAVLSAKANRIAGQLVGVTPATAIKEMINCLPVVLEKLDIKTGIGGKIK